MLQSMVLFDIVIIIILYVWACHLYFVMVMVGVSCESRIVCRLWATFFIFGIHYKIKHLRNYFAKETINNFSYVDYEMVIDKTRRQSVAGCQKFIKCELYDRQHC